MKPLVRAMELEDLAQVLKVEEACFKTPWSRKSFEFELKSNPIAHYLVVELDDKIKGYAGIWNILSEGHITNICVLNEFRGLGLGRLLLSNLIGLSRAMRVETISLEVRESNLVAQSLYKSFGFKRTGIRPRYYVDNGEDAILMLMNLKDR